MGQVLTHHLPSPVDLGIVEEPDPFRWAVQTFIPTARKALLEHGWTKVENEREEGGFFLLAVRDRLFQVGNDFQVEETADRYDACGAGEYLAIGALDVLIGQLGRDPMSAVHDALEIAERHNPWVRGPFHTMRTKMA
jgi:hypothetical protein